MEFVVHNVGNTGFSYGNAADPALDLRAGGPLTRRSPWANVIHRAADTCTKHIEASDREHSWD